MNDPPRKEESRPEPPLSEVIDSAVRRIVTGGVIGAAAIALAIYSRPAPPRFQAFAAEGAIVRVDMRSGTVLACEGQRCYTVVRRGQRLERKALPAEPPAPVTKALPAPQAPPAAKALPTPAPAPPATP
ncbi:MAG TPA: hypothetical protein VN231_10655 [Allosphingosinicella sp.]|nr:hypothetical protein [Allosphingosinicella sp.]